MGRKKVEKKQSEEEVPYEISYLIGSNSLIVRNILENFNNAELEKMKEVCSMWKGVAEQILKNRIIILHKNIPYEVLNEVITKPEVILPYLETELEPNTQFITEFHEFVGGSQEHASPSRSKLSPSAAEQRLILTQVAIFPKVSGIRLFPFSFIWNESFMDENDISDISEVVTVPERDIKCLLLFINGNIDNINYDILPACSIGGVFSTLTSLDLCRGIAIMGENVHAVSFPLFDEELLREAERISYVDKLKQYNIDGNKCIAFLFTDRGYSDCYTLTEFKDMFPNAPILFFNFALVFGFSCISGVNEPHVNEFFISENVDTMGLLSLLWYD